MAQKQRWTLVVSFIIGAAAASVFWYHDSYIHKQLISQTVEEFKGQLRQPEPKAELENMRNLASPFPGWRYQLVSDGKEVFLADLKDGRVWRYFHQTKPSGKEDEGFLPLTFYFAGKKFPSALEANPEVETPPAAPKPKEKPAT